MLHALMSAVRDLDNQVLEAWRRDGLILVDRPPTMLEDLLRTSAAEDLLFTTSKSSGGRVIAYLAAISLSGWLHIEEMAVHISMRRRKLGTALVGALQQECADRLAKVITLTTDRFLPENFGFYATLGFSACDHRTANAPAHLALRLADETKIFANPRRRIAMKWERPR